MNILISDDNNQKFERIKKVVLETYPNAFIHRTIYAKDTINSLDDNQFDLIIQDMSLPINADGRIELRGGLYVLRQLARKRNREKKYDIKVIVCSSDEASYQYMKEEGFENTPFVNYSSFVFKNDLLEIIKK